MLKFKAILIVGSLVLCSSSFAKPCDNDDVLCLQAKAPITGRYLRIEINGKSGIFCAEKDQSDSNFNMNVDSNQMNRVMSVNLFHLGANEIAFYQCDNANCNNEITIGDYHFNLNKDANGEYVANPKHYSFVIQENFGAACHKLSFKHSLFLF